MSLQSTLDGIGYVAWHKIQVKSESTGKVSLSLPLRDDLLNYVGTAHAGALFTLAETAAGVAADSVASGMNAFILLRNSNVNYIRRASGDLVATGEVSGSAALESETQFKEQGKADLTTMVQIDDSDSNTVFNGTFNYAIRARKS